MDKIALVGLPNVGKSTLFNKMTKEKQYTGNWSGKTVDVKQSKYKYRNTSYLLYDLPGTYSLLNDNIVKDYIKIVDLTIIVCDGVNLEKNLYLILQVLEMTDNVILAINMVDEIKKDDINIDLERLSNILKIKIVPIVARDNLNVKKLKKEISEFKRTTPFKIKYLSSDHLEAKMQKIIEVSNNIASVVIKKNFKKKFTFDRLLSSKKTGIPIMLMTLFIVFWLTIVGSNYPSTWLYNFFFWFEGYLVTFLSFLPVEVSNILVFGVYRVLTWVIAVMLPPMLIFFPLFTLLEESGLLPRIAFNLDKYFKKCHACGNQALTMCMGFGCNAIGVSGARIIQNKYERLIAIITNSFVPCNGRFPSIIAIITMFFVGLSTSLLATTYSALLLLAIILFGVLMTFIVSKLLSLSILKSKESTFFLELPVYRRPKIIKVITKAIIDRIFFVLGKALLIAAPAGLIIYLMANTMINDTSILVHFINLLDPIAYYIGLDGEILVAFLLGFPANEIVIPIMMMSYMQQGLLENYDSLFTLKSLLLDNGWTVMTAICFTVFCLMHFPCSTTCLTIKKETGSLFYTFLSFIIPLGVGCLICFVISGIYRIIF